MSATASFDDVRRMLEDCAPGATWRTATHSVVVSYNGRKYPSLPKYKNLELGHIRKMVRHLGIDQQCAAKHIPGSFKVVEKEDPRKSSASSS